MDWSIFSSFYSINILFFEKYSKTFSCTVSRYNDLSKQVLYNVSTLAVPRFTFTWYSGTWFSAQDVFPSMKAFRKTTWKVVFITLRAPLRRCDTGSTAMLGNWCKSLPSIDTPAAINCPRLTACEGWCWAGRSKCVAAQRWDVKLRAASCTVWWVRAVAGRVTGSTCPMCWQTTWISQSLSSPPVGSNGSSCLPFCLLLNSPLLWDFCMITSLKSACSFLN